MQGCSIHEPLKHSDETPRLQRKHMPWWQSVVGATPCDLQSLAIAIAGNNAINCTEALQQVNQSQMLRYSQAFAAAQSCLSQPNHALHAHFPLYPNTFAVARRPTTSGDAQNRPMRDT
jgi:hypothetical protein